MSGEVTQRHGDVSAHRIEVLAARQAPRVGIFEVADVPSVALDPPTDAIGGPNRCGHLGDGPNGGESDVHGERGKHCAEVAEMDVRVVDAGHDAAPIEVDDLGARPGERRDLVVAAHRGDAIATNSHRLDDVGAARGHDLPAHEHAVGSAVPPGHAAIVRVLVTPVYRQIYRFCRVYELARAVFSRRSWEAGGGTVAL